MKNLPQRKNIDHRPPWWLPTEGQRWMVTVNCKQRGVNQLCNSKMLEAFKSSIEFRNEQDKWRCSIFILMPDHIHMIVSLLPGDSLSKAIGNWKRWMTKQYGVQWQINFHDYRIRNNESLSQKAEYLFNNPVRAGLCETYHEWPYLWVDKYDGKGVVSLRNK